MNILLTGATGFIGRHILLALAQQGYKVFVCCRSAEKLIFKSDKASIVQVNFSHMTQEADWLPYLSGIDAVVNCVGIIAESRGQRFQTIHAQAPIALFNAAEKAGVKKIVQISALGADDSAVSAYHLSKKSADDVLRSLQVDWAIIQPSIVYGDGAQSMALFHALAILPVHALIEGGQQLMQPVHVSDVVATTILCLRADTPCRLTLALVGPKAVSFKQLLQQLRVRLGKKVAPVFSLSGSLAQRFVVLGKYLDEPAFNAENIAMLRRGNCADVNAIEKFLGRPTSSLEKKLLLKPATQAERWHAGLYFLRPLLRLSIAFLWLWSGIVSLFFFSHEQSYAFLAASNITGHTATAMLFSLSLIDIGLGIATLSGYRIRQLIVLQLIIIMMYTLTISFTLPEFWLHPFGPVLKNIPLCFTLLVYLQLEGEKP